MKIIKKTKLSILTASLLFGLGLSAWGATENITFSGIGGSDSCAVSGYQTLTGENRICVDNNISIFGGSDLYVNGNGPTTYIFIADGTNLTNFIFENLRVYDAGSNITLDGDGSSKTNIKFYDSSNAQIGSTTYLGSNHTFSNSNQVDLSTIFGTTFNTSGVAKLELTIESGQSLSNFSIVKLTINPSSNTTPTFVNSSPISIIVDEDSINNNITEDLNISDSDSSQTITWIQGSTPIKGSLNFTSATANSGSTNIKSTGTIKYTPTADLNGSDTFDINVSDGSASASVTVNVTINNINDAPVITSNSGGATASITTPENNSSIITTVTSTDIDSDTITYSISGVDSALFSINSSTGVLTFVSPPDYESPIDSGSDNIYNITVTATDNGTGTLHDSQNLTITVTNIIEIPANPTNLVVNRVNNNDLNLTWIDNSTTESSFKIYSSNDGVSYDLNQTLSSNTITYLFSNLTLDKEYYFKVSAYHTDGESNSSADSNTTAPNTATALSAIEHNSTQINLTWSDNSTIESGYKIYSSTTSGSGYSLLSNEIADTQEYNATGLIPATTYYFIISTYTLSTEVNSSEFFASMNSSPTFSFFNDFNLSEDFGVHTLTIADLADADSDDINFSIDSNDSSLVTFSKSWSDSNLTSAQYNGVNLTLTLTSISNKNGIVEFNLTAYDGNSYLSNVFDVNITAINDTPVVSTISDISKTVNFTEFNVSINIDDIEREDLNLTVDINDTSLIDFNTTWSNPDYNLSYNEYNSSDLNLTIKSKLDMEGVVRFVVSVKDDENETNTTFDLDISTPTPTSTSTPISTSGGSVIYVAPVQNKFITDTTLENKKITTFESNINEKVVKTEITVTDDVTSSFDSIGNFKNSILLETGVKIFLTAYRNDTGVSSTLLLPNSEKVTILTPVGSISNLSLDGLKQSFQTDEGIISVGLLKSGEIDISILLTNGERVNLVSNIESSATITNSGEVTQNFNLTKIDAKIVATKRAEVKGVLNIKESNQKIEINLPKNTLFNIDTDSINALTEDSNYLSLLKVDENGVNVNVQTLKRARERNITYSSRRNASDIKVEVLFPKKDRFRRVEIGEIRSNYSYRREISKSLSKNREISNLSITPNGEAQFEEKLYFDGTEELTLKEGELALNANISDREFNMLNASSFKINLDKGFKSTQKNNDTLSSLEYLSNGDFKLNFQELNLNRDRISKNRVSYSPRRDISNVKVDFISSNSRDRIEKDRAEVKYSYRRELSFRTNQRDTKELKIAPLSNEIELKEYIYSDGEYKIELIDGVANIYTENNISLMEKNILYSLPNLDILKDNSYISELIDFNISIKKGWNLLVSPIKKDITDMFIFSNFDKIWLYDKGIWIKNPLTIPYESAFWLKSNIDENISFRGKSYSKNTDTIGDSWSLVGIGEIPNEITQRQKSYIDKIYVYRENSFKELSTLTKLKFAEPFWIKKKIAKGYIVLNRGWNLSSNPQELTFNDFSTLEDYVSILTFNNNLWEYSPNKIDKNQGFWINMSNALEIPYYDLELETNLSDINHKSWYLKGGYIKNINEHDCDFWLYRNNKWYSNKLDNLKNIKVGEGFWVK